MSVLGRSSAGASAGVRSFEFSGPSSVPRMTWTHLALVAARTPKNRVTLYMNGVPVGQAKGYAFPLPMIALGAPCQQVPPPVTPCHPLSPVTPLSYSLILSPFHLLRFLRFPCPYPYHRRVHPYPYHHPCVPIIPLSQSFHGVLLDVRYWNKQRSALEIQQSMHRLVQMQTDDNGMLVEAKPRIVKRSRPGLDTGKFLSNKEKNRLTRLKEREKRRAARRLEGGGDGNEADEEDEDDDGEGVKGLGQVLGSGEYRVMTATAVAGN